MKVCFFLNGFYGGGAEKMTIILANELSKEGHDVTILVQHHEGPAERFLDEAVHVIDMCLPSCGKIVKSFYIVSQLREALRPDRFDILAAVCADRAQMAALAAGSLRKPTPLIAVIHNTLSQETYQKIRQLLFPVVNKRYDRVIAVSEGARSDYIRVCHAPARQVVTVYNPVIDVGFEQRANEALAHPWLCEKRDFVTFVQAGRLCPQKNHKLMFQALRLLNQSGGDYRLILLGDGELRGELENEAKGLNLQDKIEFAGYVDNPFPYFKTADVVTLSSSHEGLPTVLIEALACGAKIVSTDCPSGPREILKDGTLGILVPCGSPALLAEGIKKALAWTPDRSRLQARARDFTLRQSADGYLAVFRDVLRENRISGEIT